MTSKDDWRKLEIPYNDSIFGKFILVYSLYWDKKYNAQLRKLHKQGYQIVGVFSAKNRDVYCNKALYDVGVQEFLWLVDHAEAVVTSSFHGFAFATIFEKKMSIIINPDSPSRINNAIKLMGIKNSAVDAVMNNEQDFSLIKSTIEAEKKRSIAYLKEILHEE